MPDSEPEPGAGKGPNSFVPKPRFEYKAPSMLAEHKILALLFVLVFVAATVYLVRVPRKPYAIKPTPPPPVYIEPIRDTQSIPERPVPAAR